MSEVDGATGTWLKSQARAHRPPQRCPRAPQNPNAATSSSAASRSRCKSLDQRTYARKASHASASCRNSLRATGVRACRAGTQAGGHDRRAGACVAGVSMDAHDRQLAVQVWRIVPAAVVAADACTRPADRDLGRTLTVSHCDFVTQSWPLSSTPTGARSPHGRHGGQEMPAQPRFSGLHDASTITP